jgi:PAS domain S-box-containing protein
MSGTSFLDELKSYIGFTDEDAVTLSEFRPFAAASFPAIADEFYALIRLHEGAFAVLRDEAQARRLHASLQVWLDELLSGPYDEAYVARHGRIGQVHVRVGLPQHYMVTAMSRVRGSLRDLSRRLFSKDPTAEARCGAAIEHICDIDLAIMLESYRRDLDARIARVRALEREATESPRADPTRFLAAVFEVADVAILGFHSEGTLVFWNRKAEALTGYASDEVVGTDPFDRLFAEHAGAMRGQLLSATPTVPVEIEEEMVTRSGRIRRVRWHATAEARAGAASSTVVVVACDVTVERELECILTVATRWCWGHDPSHVMSNDWFTERLARAVFGMAPSRHVISRLSEVLVLATAAGIIASAAFHSRGHRVPRASHP